MGCSVFYKVDRLSRAHNLVRSAAYAVLWRLPDWLKYGFGSVWRSLRQPYKLLGRGDAAVQVGAPWDTLRAGRSRAAYFARFVGQTGRVVVVEPSDSNVTALGEFAARHDLPQLTVVPTGAWDKKTHLRFLVNPDHPASNLVEEVIVEGRDREQFEVTDVAVDTLDNIVAESGIEKIKLLSITTNGSEMQVLKGAAKTLAMVEYVSIITPDASEFLSSHGFGPFGEDDRGYLFRRT